MTEKKPVNKNIVREMKIKILVEHTELFFRKSER